MSDQAPAQHDADTAQCRMFITLEITGERRRVSECVTLLQDQLQDTVDFFNGLYSLAAPRTKNVPVILIHPTQAE